MKDEAADRRADENKYLFTMMIIKIKLGVLCKVYLFAIRNIENSDRQGQVR